MNEEVSRLWDRRVRVAFWILGIALGGVLAFTTRHFTGGDALPYTEMGEALVTGEWCRLINCCVGPIYPILLGIGQILLHTDPITEVPRLKAVNFVCFLVAMASCEVVLHFVRAALSHCRRHGSTSLPFPVVRALCYGMFLFGALSLIRVRLTNPDMLANAMVLFLAATVMWIRVDPARYSKFVLLGLLAGVGYLTKTYIFVYSAVFFLLAGLCAGSLRKAVPRVSVALLVMLVLAAPYIASISQRVGRLTFGLTGTHMYALHVSGKGDPIHPKLVHESPDVLFYQWDIPCTRPKGLDLGYWVDGLWPRFVLSTQVKAFESNFLQILESHQWLLVIVAYFALHAAFIGPIRMGGLSPPSVFWIFMVPSIAGLGLFSAVHLESRYLPPFLFLGFTALVSGARYSPEIRRSRRMAKAGIGLLGCLFVALLAETVIKQSLRGLRATSAKPSYREALVQQTKVRQFLEDNGVEKGQPVCTVGNPPYYWARMAGVTVLAEIPDLQTYVAATPKERSKMHHLLKQAEIKALIATDARLQRLRGEGWRRIHGTRDCFALLLDS